MISDYMHSSDIKMSKPIIHTAVDKYVKTNKLNYRLNHK